MAKNLTTKNDLLDKLRGFRTSPDDESIRYKNIIKDALIRCPELLYAINEKDLENELFNEDGDINWEYDEVSKKYEPLGEWDRYFGEHSNIRPFLHIPDVMTKVKTIVCYQVSFDDLPKYNARQKYTEITFTIFCHEDGLTDELTGIPRHDLIASIIRDRFNWSNIFGSQVHCTSSKESVMDNHYVTRVVTFEIEDLNGIYNQASGTANYHVRR